MAKLGIYYALCPLIDHRSLLGISDDADTGVVIVTLGKNIAIKYRLFDQKPVNSWRTKEKFTSPVIYDKAQSMYLAVFNQSYIRTWSSDEEQLDKLKRYKFTKEIHTLFSCNRKTIIVFDNGDYCLLSDGIARNKTLSPDNIIDTVTHYIADVVYSTLNNEIYIGLVVRSISGSSICFYWSKLSTDDVKQKFCKIVLARDNFELAGHVIHIDNGSVNLVTLWNDGRLFSCPLCETDADIKNPGDLLALVDSISTKESVSMMSLDENYIAMYGGDSNDEGALVTIYNVQFKITQSRQLFKLFTQGARLYDVADHLMFAVGQNLAVLPYYLDTEQLAALVGSHKQSELDADVVIVQQVDVATWRDQKQGGKKKLKKAALIAEKFKLLKTKISDFVSQGLPESIIIEQLVPELIAKNDLKLISECVNYFCDIPEKYLVQLIKFVINLDDSNSLLLEENENNKNYEELDDCTKLIDVLLAKSYSDVLILPHIQSALDLHDVSILLRYICFLFSSSNDRRTLCDLDTVESERRLIDWGCVILDGNYQKILLTKDRDIHALLVEFSNVVREELDCLSSLREIMPLLSGMQEGTINFKSRHFAGNDYSIDQLDLPYDRGVSSTT